MSFGQGGNDSLNLHWFSKKNIGFGFKLNTLFGSGFSHNETLSTFTGTEFYKYTNKSFSFQFIPHLCFRHEFKVVSPVLEAGMIIGMAQINSHYQVTHSFYTDIIKSTVRDYGGVLLGFYSSLGLSFNVSRVVKINLALNGSVGSYSPTSRKRTEFTVNGINQLSALSTSDAFGTYVKELALPAPPRSNAPSKDLKYSAAFSNIGLSAGICFVFAKRHKKETKKDEPNAVHPF